MTNSENKINTIKLNEFTDKRMLHVETNDDVSFTFYDYFGINEISNFAFQFLYLKDQNTLSCNALIETEGTDELIWNDTLKVSAQDYFKKLVELMALEALAKPPSIFFEGATTTTPHNETIYPDMDLKAQQLTYEYFEIESFDELDQKRIDDVDHIVALAASDVTHNVQLPGAIVTLTNTHPEIAELLTKICHASLIRDHVQENAF